MLYFYCFYNNIDIFILRGIHKKGIIRFGTYTISLMIPYDFFIKLCICLRKALQLGTKCCALFLYDLTGEFTMKILHITPSQDGFYMPAEFAPQEDCLMIWSERADS